MFIILPLWANWDQQTKDVDKNILKIKSNVICHSVTRVTLKIGLQSLSFRLLINLTSCPMQYYDRDANINLYQSRSELQKQWTAWSEINWILQVRYRHGKGNICIEHTYRYAIDTGKVIFALSTLTNHLHVCLTRCVTVRTICLER